MEYTGKHMQLNPYPIGWKAKLGFLIPSHDSGYGSYELRVMSPDGVVPLETRVMVRKVVKDELRKAAEDAVDGAKMLATANVDVINYIATATCFVLGVKGEDSLVKEIAAITGIKCTAGGQSVSEALRFLGAKKILTYTPYNNEVEDIMRVYFEEGGFEIVGSKNLQFEDPKDINHVSPREIFSDVVNLYKNNPGADAIFIVGGCFRTLEIIDTLEKYIGIPIVGTQQANMWHCLQMCGVPDLLNGFGKLLELPRLEFVHMYQDISNNIKTAKSTE